MLTVPSDLQERLVTQDEKDLLRYFSGDEVSIEACNCNPEFELIVRLLARCTNGTERDAVRAMVPAMKLSLAEKELFADVADLQSYGPVSDLANWTVMDKRPAIQAIPASMTWDNYGGAGAIHLQAVMQNPSPGQTGSIAARRTPSAFSIVPGVSKFRILSIGRQVPQGSPPSTTSGWGVAVALTAPGFLAWTTAILKQTAFGVTAPSTATLTSSGGSSIGFVTCSPIVLNGDTFSGVMVDFDLGTQVCVPYVTNDDGATWQVNPYQTSISLVGTVWDPVTVYPQAGCLVFANGGTDWYNDLYIHQISITAI